jgi:hypothetical protein
MGNRDVDRCIGRSTTISVDVIPQPPQQDVQLKFCWHRSRKAWKDLYSSRVSPPIRRLSNMRINYKKSVVVVVVVVMVAVVVVECTD